MGVDVPDFARGAVAPHEHSLGEVEQLPQLRPRSSTCEPRRLDQRQQVRARVREQRRQVRAQHRAPARWAHGIGAGPGRAVLAA